MLHANWQKNVFHYPLVAGVVGAPARGQNIVNQLMLSEILLSASQHQTFLKKCYKVLLTVIGGAIVAASRGSIIIGHLNWGRGHI